jgi:uncharacterized protein (DUF488 family)
MQGVRKRFYTLGYQGHSVRSMLQLLDENEVDLLIDVRQNPVSRKKGFSGSRLKAQLEQYGIEYVHYPCLGTPARIRAQYRINGSASAALKAYTRYLNTKEPCLKSLIDFASSKRYCLLCLEKNYNLCHRAVIAKKLTEMTQWQPIHLT